MDQDSPQLRMVISTVSVCRDDASSKCNAADFSLLLRAESRFSYLPCTMSSAFIIMRLSQNAFIKYNSTTALFRGVLGRLWLDPVGQPPVPRHTPLFSSELVHSHSSDSKNRSTWQEGMTLTRHLELPAEKP